MAIKLGDDLTAIFVAHKENYLKVLEDSPIIRIVDLVTLHPRKEKTIYLKTKDNLQQGFSFPTKPLKNSVSTDLLKKEVSPTDYSRAIFFNDSKGRTELLAVFLLLRTLTTELNAIKTVLHSDC